MLERCTTAVPSRSGAEVDAHAEWWAQHLERLGQKKGLVEAWRADKRLEVLVAVERCTEPSLGLTR